MPELLGEFQVYPRGFLGRPLGREVSKKYLPYSDGPSTNTFNLSILETQTAKRPGDKLISRLYSQLVRGERSTDSADFREDIFRAAISAFNTRDFSQWYIVQKASPLFGENHYYFLEDTIRYLSGDERRYSIQTWETLLTLGIDETTSREDSELVKSYFGFNDTALISDNEHRKVTENLQAWWGRTNGIADLLHTLNILFGDVT